MLVDTGGHAAQALVFEVDAKGAREAHDLAASLGAKAAEGKILPLRQALQEAGGVSTVGKPVRTSLLRSGV